jgi:DNA-binding transcriptional MerR regulator
MELIPSSRVPNMSTDDDGGDDDGQRFLTAGELARLAGVSKDTLRFYERRGLLTSPRRRANNYRLYSPEALSDVLWIRRILAAGFTVAELLSVLAERRAGGAPCRKVRDLGAAKLALMEERLRAMSATCESLRELLRDWDRRLAGLRLGERAGLLETLRQRPPAAAAPLPHPSQRRRKEK